MESNVFFFLKVVINERIVDESFVLFGGGSFNLYIFC